MSRTEDERGARRMKAEEVERLVRREIGPQWSRDDWPHGVDLWRCLVPPRKRRAVANWDPRETVELWVVLEENPGADLGYKVTFDERQQEFGLATADADGRLHFLGNFGGLIQALEAM